MNTYTTTSKPIVRAFHFIFGLRPQNEPFHLLHYLALRSCLEVNAPCIVNVHLGEEPFGQWWQLIRPHIIIHELKRDDWTERRQMYEQSKEGQFILSAGLQYAHEADFLRGELLAKYGGVYVDMDTLFITPYPADWFSLDFALGEEQVHLDERGIQRITLCNAVMFSQPNSEFSQAMLKMMANSFDGRWNTHSCWGIAQLWGQIPHAITVFPQRYFYRFSADQNGISALFEKYVPDIDGVYSLHLWEHLWRDAWRTDFTAFHAGMLTTAYVKNAPTTYAALARRFLD